jgi:4-hydroxybenzoate polyprenyltransferase
MLRDYVALMRPAQYVKNLSLFLPAFFALRLDEPAVLLRTLAGFAAYCLTASGVYIFNDYLDREEDSLHPVKRSRPLAAGKVSPSGALLLMGLLLMAGVALFLLLDKSAFYLVSAYVILNLLYTFRVKQIAILDLVFIAAGFMIRIATGAALAEPHIPLSLWIELMIFLGAMFLGLAKRRDDVLLSAQGAQTRKSAKGYNLEFINAGMVIMASVLIVSYIFWTLSPEVQQRLGSSSLHLTVVFVLIGVLRYLQITFVEGESGNPGKVFLQDRFLQLTLLGWILSFVLLLY